MAAEKRTTTARVRSTGVENLLRELLALSTENATRLEDFAARLEATQDDARQARDLGNRISTILEEQNIIARFDAHKTDVRQQISEIRQDFVAANTKVRDEIVKLEGRLKELENEQQRREGIKSLAGWLMKNAPWLFAGFAAFVAGLGLQDKIK